MFFRIIRHGCIALTAALSVFLAGGPTRAETKVGSNVDSRVVVAVATPLAGVDAMMPEGWTNVPFPGGPLGGANLLFVFIDSQAQFDADGVPLSPSMRRAVALVGLGKEDAGEAVRLYVLRIYTTTPDADPYGVNIAAEIGRVSSIEGPANGGRTSRDAWSVAVAGGGTLGFELDYTTGNRGWTPGEAFPYSASDPGFSRIYRFDQLVDLVVSEGLGKPSSGTFGLTSDIPELSGILDGTEEIRAVLDVPVYVREISLP